MGELDRRISELPPISQDTLNSAADVLPAVNAGSTDTGSLTPRAIANIAKGRIVLLRPGSGIVSDWSTAGAADATGDGIRGTNLAAAITAAQAGDCIYVPAGNYLIQACWKHNVTIFLDDARVYWNSANGPLHITNAAVTTRILGTGVIENTVTGGLVSDRNEAVHLTDVRNPAGVAGVDHSAIDLTLQARLVKTAGDLKYAIDAQYAGRLVLDVQNVESSNSGLRTVGCREVLGSVRQIRVTSGTGFRSEAPVATSGTPRYDLQIGQITAAGALPGLVMADTTGAERGAVRVGSVVNAASVMGAIQANATKLQLLVGYAECESAPGAASSACVNVGTNARCSVNYAENKHAAGLAAWLAAGAALDADTLVGDVMIAAAANTAELAAALSVNKIVKKGTHDVSSTAAGEDKGFVRFPKNFAGSVAANITVVNGAGAGSPGGATGDPVELWEVPGDAATTDFEFDATVFGPPAATVGTDLERGQANAAAWWNPGTFTGTSGDLTWKINCNLTNVSSINTTIDRNGPRKDNDSDNRNFILGWSGTASGVSRLTITFPDGASNASFTVQDLKRFYIADPDDPYYYRLGTVLLNATDAGSQPLAVEIQDPVNVTVHGDATSRYVCAANVYPVPATSTFRVNIPGAVKTLVLELVGRGEDFVSAASWNGTIRISPITYDGGSENPVLADDAAALAWYLDTNNVQEANRNYGDWIRQDSKLWQVVYDGAVIPPNPPYKVVRMAATDAAGGGGSVSLASAFVIPGTVDVQQRRLNLGVHLTGPVASYTIMAYGDNGQGTLITTGPFTGNGNAALVAGTSIGFTGNNVIELGLMDQGLPITFVIDAVDTEGAHHLFAVPTEVSGTGSGSTLGSPAATVPPRVYDVATSSGNVVITGNTVTETGGITFPVGNPSAALQILGSQLTTEGSVDDKRVTVSVPGPITELKFEMLRGAWAEINSLTYTPSGGAEISGSPAALFGTGLANQTMQATSLDGTVSFEVTTSLQDGQTGWTAVGWTGADLIGFGDASGTLRTVGQGSTATLRFATAVTDVSIRLNDVDRQGASYGDELIVVTAVGTTLSLETAQAAADWYVDNVLPAARNFGDFVTQNGNVWQIIDADGQSTIGALRLEHSRQVVSSEETAITLTKKDAGRWLRCTSGTSVTVTLATQAVGNFEVGDEIFIEQAGAGVVTIGGAGITVVRPVTYAAATAGQGAVVQLKYVGSDNWVLTGDRATA